MFVTAGVTAVDAGADRFLDRPAARAPWDPGCLAELPESPEPLTKFAKTNVFMGKMEISISKF